VGADHGGPDIGMPTDGHDASSITALAPSFALPHLTVYATFDYRQSHNSKIIPAPPIPEIRIWRGGSGSIKGITIKRKGANFTPPLPFFRKWRGGFRPVNHLLGPRAGLSNMNHNNSRQVLCSYAKALAGVGVAIVVGLYGGFVMRSKFSWNETSIVIFRCISVGLLATSALGRLGWIIQTWGGNSQAERFNMWLFRVLYLVGLILTVVSFSFKPF
jgi:hypothetical protein